MTDVRTFLMPVESTVRELDYKLMLATMLASPKRRFLLFRHDLGPKLVGLVRGGVWCGQHLRTRTDGADDYSLLHRMKDAGFVVAFIDEEGAVFHGGDEDWRRDLFVRLDPSKLEKDDVILTWGSFQAETYRARRPKADVIAAGHPRFDLCRAPYSRIYEPTVERLRRELGGYVLVNTNFGLANYVNGIAGIFNRRDGYRPENVEGRVHFVANWRRALATFGEFVEAIHHLSARYPKLTFVVRPHPIENHDSYRRLLFGLDNVKVIHSGGVIPWLRSATKVVHNGCTTALEAHLAGASVINYVPHAAADAGEAWVATLFGRRAASLQALDEAIGSDAVGSEPSDPERLARAASMIIQVGEEGRDPTRAFKLVVEAIDRIEAENRAKPRFDVLKVKALGCAHAAGVRTKMLLSEAGSYIGRVQYAPRKFVSFVQKDIDARLEQMKRITGKSLRADVISSTLLVLY